MSMSVVFREPGLNEKRCIVRHGLKYYHGLTVAGVYNLKASDASLHDLVDDAILRLFARALRRCIQEHPILSALVEGEDSDQPKFRRASAIDLNKHFKVIRPNQVDHRLPGVEADARQSSHEHELIRQALEHVMNDDFEDVSVTPPWRVYLLRFPSRAASATRSTADIGRDRVLVAYSFSHSHGDGSSALMFHRTFFEALNSSTTDIEQANRGNEELMSVQTPNKQLPFSVDSPNLLPISWSYLLSTLLKEINLASLFPRFLQNLFRKPATYTEVLKPWIGKEYFFEDKLPTTAVQTVTISGRTIDSILTQGRQHGAKLTGIMHQLIVNALCQTLHDHGIQCNSSITSTPIDLRRPHGMIENQMGVMASAVTLTIEATPLTPLSSANPSSIQNGNGGPTSSTSDNELRTKFWHAARQTTSSLANASSSLWDQPIGLLRYLSSLRKWHTDKLGKARESTYELSNIMTFDGGLLPLVQLQQDTSLPSPASSPSPSQEQDQTQNQSQNQDQDQDSAEQIYIEATTVEKMFFAQSADVTANIISFNIVSMRNGDLVICITWQLGAFGLVDSTSTSTPKDEVDLDVQTIERNFVDVLVDKMHDEFLTLAQSQGR